MKKKYYESNYGKQHERVAPKNAEHIKAFMDSVDMPSIGAKERYYVIGAKSSVSRRQSSMNIIEQAIKDVEKYKAEARAAHEAKREYYEGREEVEIRATVEAAILNESLKEVIEYIEAGTEIITVSTTDWNWVYTVNKQYMLNLIDRIQYDKSLVERAAIEAELSNQEAKPTTKTRSI